MAKSPTTTEMTHRQYLDSLVSLGVKPLEASLVFGLSERQAYRLAGGDRVKPQLRKLIRLMIARGVTAEEVGKL